VRTQEEEELQPLARKGEEFFRTCNFQAAEAEAILTGPGDRAVQPRQTP
jgi:hypothetical protein